MKALLILQIIALIHDAPSGWSYPANCCNGQDCHPVPCAEVSQVPAPGGYVGPWFMWQGLTFSRNQHQYAPDGQCHVCVGQRYPLQPPMVPRCIFTPIPASS